MELGIFKTTEVLNWNIFVYGSPEEPLFLAKDVAEWIEHSQASKMIESIDEDEKLIGTLFLSGQNREAWMLTENGLYEVLMQSRKPIAKDFKRAIKNILKEIRTNGGYIASSPEDSPELIMAKALQVAAHTIESNKQKIKTLEHVNEIQSEQLKKAQPLIQLASDCYVSTVTMTASIISARLGFKSANAFNNALKI